MKYLAVIEPSDTGYSGYFPDLPGCVSTGATLDEVKANLREALQFHIDGMREDNLPLPAPAVLSELVSV